MDSSIHIYNSQQNNNHHIFKKFSLTKHHRLTPLQKSDGTQSWENEGLQNSDGKENPKKLPMFLGGTAVVLGLGMVMFSREFQKNAVKYLNVLKDYMERKLEISSINERSKASAFYEYSIHKINSFIQKSESINNITSLKDILFMRLMYSTKPTKKIHKFITDVFEGLSRKTITNSYKKTKTKFNNMYKIFDNLDEVILKESPDELIEYQGKMQTKAELVKLAKYYRDNVRIVVDSFTTELTAKSHYQHIKNSTSTLYSRFWDVSFKDFWSKDNKFKRKEMWQTFIAAEQVKPDKAWLEEKVAILRNVLSYTEGDRTNLIAGYLKKLNALTPAKDIEGIDLLKRLEWFARSPEGLKNYREIFEKELEKLSLHNPPENISEEAIAAYTKNKNSYIGLIKDILNDTGTGEIQDMMAIYYKIAPFELSKSGAELAVKKAVKSFDKSANLENLEFFDKLRDLELGSAPTDVLTILTSFIMISFGLGYAKDKDERISVMLKSGIPIAGAIATSMISATKLVSGGKSLALGIISGLILNKCGSLADKFRRSFMQKS